MVRTGLTFYMAHAQPTTIFISEYDLGVGPKDRDIDEIRYDQIPGQSRGFGLVARPQFFASLVKCKVQ